MTLYNIPKVYDKSNIEIVMGGRAACVYEHSMDSQGRVLENMARNLFLTSNFVPGISSQSHWKSRTYQPETISKVTILF